MCECCHRIVLCCAGMSPVSPATRQARLWPRSCGPVDCTGTATTAALSNARLSQSVSHTDPQTCRLFYCWVNCRLDAAYRLVTGNVTALVDFAVLRYRLVSEKGCVLAARIPLHFLPLIRTLLCAGALSIAQSSYCHCMWQQNKHQTRFTFL